jgi:hypothetical protein
MSPQLLHSPSHLKAEDLDQKEKARAASAAAPARASPYAVNWPNADGDPHRTVRQPAQVRTARRR